MSAAIVEGTRTRKSARAIWRADHPLPGAPNVDPTTRKIGQNTAAAFSLWLREAGFTTTLSILANAPAYLDHLLEHYGRDLYIENECLYLFRYLVTFLQREYFFANLKHRLPRAWNLVTVWEEIEPVEHRPPWPIRLLKAVVAILIVTGCARGAACVSAIFYGITRPMEVVLAQRRQLMLAREAGMERDEVLIHHVKPKTRRRAAKQQYSTVLDKCAMQLIEREFAHLSPDDYLWPCSPYDFQKHLDGALRRLEVPAGVFGAGGLRGGGACAAFRQERDIANLCWRMRIKGQDTLSAYLQEVSAAIGMQALSPSAREKVETAAQLYSAILDAS